MTVRFPKLVSCTPLLLGCAVLGSRAAEPVAPAPSAVPPISATLTNLNGSAPRKDGLKQFEEEITRSLQPFSPKGSLDGLMGPQYRPPPPRIIVPNQRAKDEAERRKNWIFGAPEEQKGLRDPFNLLDPSSSPARKNSLDEFYDRLNRQRAGTAARSSRDNLTSRPGQWPTDNPDLDDTSKLPSGVRESAKSLKEKLGLGENASTFNPGGSRSSFWDLFTPGDKTLSREQIQAHKDYLDRFKQMLEGPPPSTPNSQNLLNSLAGSGTATPAATIPGLDAYTSPKSDSFAGTPAGMNSVLNPLALPDLNGKVLNQWNPLYELPKETPAKALPPVSPPMMEIPRRRF